MFWDLDDETAAVRARSTAKALDSPSDYQGGPVHLPCVYIIKNFNKEIAFLYVYLSSGQLYMPGGNLQFTMYLSVRVPVKICSSH